MLYYLNFTTWGPYKTTIHGDAVMDQQLDSQLSHSIFKTETIQNNSSKMYVLCDGVVDQQLDSKCKGSMFKSQDVVNVWCLSTLLAEG